MLFKILITWSHYYNKLLLKLINYYKVAYKVNKLLLKSLVGT